MIGNSIGLRWWQLLGDANSLLSEQYHGKDAVTPFTSPKFCSS
jgi:hypothetical protein